MNFYVRRNEMKKSIFLVVVMMMAVPAMAGNITWEAHYNDGDKNADYAENGVLTPWPGSQTTTPLVTGGYTGGAIAPNAASSTNLNYSNTGGNVSLAAGTLSVRVKPNFSSSAGTHQGSIVCVSKGNYNRDKFINLYWESGSKQWYSNFGKLSGGSAECQTFWAGTTSAFAAGDWVHLAVAWERSTGNLTFYVNETQVSTMSAGANYWDPNGAPYSMNIGNSMGATLPFGGQFNGLVDDVVFSDAYQDTAIFSRVPEPATMGLLAVGGLFGIVRRRRKS